MLEKGFRVGYNIADGWWLDTGKKDDILYANSLILDEFGVKEIRGELVGSKAEGRVSVGEGSKIVNSSIRGPAVIGNNCLIQDSFIGPYTGIGNNARVFNSSIEYSIVLEDACIDHVDRLEESLVGKKRGLQRTGLGILLGFT